MNDYPLISQLKEASDYDKIFNLVKRTVEKTISRRRAGLSLVLTEIPNHIGAYFVEGGNNIYMNITILNAMKQLTNLLHQWLVLSLMRDIDIDHPQITMLRQKIFSFT